MSNFKISAYYLCVYTRLASFTTGVVDTGSSNTANGFSEKNSTRVLRTS